MTYQRNRSPAAGTVLGCRLTLRLARFCCSKSTASPSKMIARLSSRSAPSVTAGLVVSLVSVVSSSAMSNLHHYFRLGHKLRHRPFRYFHFVTQRPVSQQPAQPPGLCFRRQPAVGPRLPDGGKDEGRRGFAHPPRLSAPLLEEPLQPFRRAIGAGQGLAQGVALQRW